MDAVPTSGTAPIGQPVQDVVNVQHGSLSDSGNNVEKANDVVKKKRNMKHPPSFVFSKAEMDAVVSEVEKYKDELFGEYREGESAMSRWMVWMKVAEKVNRVATYPRTPDQVRLKWFEYNNQIPVTRNTLKRRTEVIPYKRKANWWYDENLEDWPKLKENSPPPMRRCYGNQAKLNVSSAGSPGNMTFPEPGPATSTPIADKKKENVIIPSEITPLSLKIKKKIMMKDINQLNMKPILVKEGNKLLKVVPIKKVNLMEVPKKVLDVTGKISKNQLAKGLARVTSPGSQLARVTIETEVITDSIDEREGGDDVSEGVEKVSDKESASEKSASQDHVVVPGAKLQVDTMPEVPVPEVIENWNPLESPEVIVVDENTWVDNGESESGSNVSGGKVSEADSSRSSLNKDRSEGSLDGEVEILGNKSATVDKVSEKDDVGDSVEDDVRIIDGDDDDVVNLSDGDSVEDDVCKIDGVEDEIVLNLSDDEEKSSTVGDVEGSKNVGYTNDGKCQEIQSPIITEKNLVENSQDEMRNSDLVQDSSVGKEEIQSAQEKTTETISVSDREDEKVVKDVVIDKSDEPNVSVADKSQSSKVNDEISSEIVEEVVSTEKAVGVVSQPVVLDENIQEIDLSKENEGIISSDPQTKQKLSEKKSGDALSEGKMSTEENSTSNNVEKSSKQDIFDKIEMAVKQITGEEDDQPTSDNNLQHPSGVSDVSKPTKSTEAIYTKLPIVGNSQQHYVAVPPGMKLVAVPSSDGRGKELVLQPCDPNSSLKLMPHLSNSTSNQVVGSQLVVNPPVPGLSSVQAGDLKTYPPRKNLQMAQHGLFPIEETVSKVRKLRPKPVKIKTSAMQSCLLQIDGTNAIARLVSVAPDVPVFNEGTAKRSVERPKVRVKSIQQLTMMPGNIGTLQYAKSSEPSSPAVAAMPEANNFNDETSFDKRPALSKVRLLNRSLKKPSPVLKTRPILNYAVASASQTRKPTSSAAVKDLAEKILDRKADGIRKRTSKLSSIDKEAVMLLKGLQTGQWDSDLSAHVDHDISEQENSIVRDSNSPLPFKISSVWTMGKSPEGSEVSRLEKDHLSSSKSEDETVNSKDDSDKLDDIRVVPKPGTDNCFLIEGGVLDLSSENNFLRESISQTISYIKEKNESIPSEFYIKNNNKFFKVYASGVEEKSSQAGNNTAGGKAVTKEGNLLRVTVHRMPEMAELPFESDNLQKQPVGKVLPEASAKNSQSKVNVTSQWRKILPKSTGEVGYEDFVPPIIHLRGADGSVLQENVEGSRITYVPARNEENLNSGFEDHFAEGFGNDDDNDSVVVIKSEENVREIPKPLKELKVNKKVVLVGRNGEVISPSKLEALKKVSRKKKKKKFLKSRLSKKKQVINLNLSFVPKEIEALRRKFMKRRERIKAMESNSVTVGEGMSGVPSGSNGLTSTERQKGSGKVSSSSSCVKVGGDGQKSPGKHVSLSKAGSESSHWLDRLVADLGVEEVSEARSSKSPSTSPVGKKSSDVPEMEILKEIGFDKRKGCVNTEGTRKDTKLHPGKRSLGEVFALGRKSSFQQPWMKKCRLDVEESSTKGKTGEGNSSSGQSLDGNVQIGKEIPELKSSGSLMLEPIPGTSKSEGFLKKTGDVSGSLRSSQDGGMQTLKGTMAELQCSGNVMISASKLETLLRRSSSDNMQVQVGNTVVIPGGVTLVKNVPNASNLMTAATPKVQVIENGTNKVIASKNVGTRDMPSLDFSHVVSKTGNKISGFVVRPQSSTVGTKCQEKNLVQGSSKPSAVQGEHRHPLVRAALIGDPLDFEAELSKDETDLSAREKRNLVKVVVPPLEKMADS